MLVFLWLVPIVAVVVAGCWHSHTAKGRRARTRATWSEPSEVDPRQVAMVGYKGQSRPLPHRPWTSSRVLVALIGVGLLSVACSVGSTTIPSDLSPAPTPITAVERITEADNGQSVALSVGSEVILTLGNTYWTVQPSLDPTVLALESGPTASGAAPSACLPGMGCGTVTATFRAITPGRAAITASRTSCGEALRCTGSAGSFEVTIIVGAVSVPSSTSPGASPEVVCDPSQLNPTPSLTCGPAIAAALGSLAPNHSPIVREEFRWGDLCPPGAPCAPPLGDQGIVIIDFASGPAVFVYLGTGPNGSVAAGSPAPYPSGY